MYITPYTRIRMVLLGIIFFLLSIVFAIVGVFAAQQTSTETQVGITYSAPIMLNKNFRNEISSDCTAIYFYYYDDAPSGIIGSSLDTEVIVDSKGLGCDAGGISLYTWKTNTYILSKNDIITPEDCSNLFAFKSYSPNLTSIELNNFHTKYTTNMQQMFDGCSSLEFLTFGTGWNTSKVKNMNWMFFEVGSARTDAYTISVALDLSTCTTMKEMFGYARALNFEINLYGNENSTHEIDMSNLLSEAKTSSLMIAGYNLKNPVIMDQAFAYMNIYQSAGGTTYPLRVTLDGLKPSSMAYMCYNSSVTSLTTGENFDTSLCKTMESMFENYNGTSAIKTITGIANWNTSKVEDMEGLFYNCSNLGNMDLSKWDMSNVTNFKNIFYNCSKFTNLGNLSNWKFNESITSLSKLFYNCSSLISIEGIGSWDTSKITDMSYMFYNCTRLSGELDISNWSLYNLDNMSYMFYNCYSLSKIGRIGRYVRPSNVSYLFYNCYGLTAIDVYNFDTDLVTDMSYMFYRCLAYYYSPTALDISGFDTSRVTNMKYMFADCSNLTTIYIGGGWTIENVPYGICDNMFSGCTSLLPSESAPTDGTYAYAGGGGYLTYI